MIFTPAQPFLFGPGLPLCMCGKCSRYGDDYTVHWSVYQEPRGNPPNLSHSVVYLTLSLAVNLQKLTLLEPSEVLSLPGSGACRSLSIYRLDNSTCEIL